MNGNSQLYRQKLKISINHGSLSRLNSWPFCCIFCSDCGPLFSEIQTAKFVDEITIREESYRRSYYILPDYATNACQCSDSNHFVISRGPIQEKQKKLILLELSSIKDFSNLVPVAKINGSNKQSVTTCKFLISNIDWSQMKITCWQYCTQSKHANSFSANRLQCNYFTIRTSGTL